MKYRSNKKNGGNVPVCHDQRLLAVPVGCGKCIECRKQKSREWQIRLQEEVREDTTGKFITLTFSNEWYKELANEFSKEITGFELDNAIATLAVRRFLERWRKEYKKSIKHWFVTELGHNGTENLHMHGIVWTTKSLESVEKHWKYGWVWKGKKKTNGELENYVNEKTVNYMIKYISKQDKIYTEYKPKILTTPGIGANYKNRIGEKTNKFNGKQTREYYTTRTGYKVALPIYWRNKIYTEKEREQLWLNKLDEKTRWVLGEKISIKDGEETYFNALKEAQEKNIRLGYGTNTTNWDSKKYQHERRILNQLKRMREKYQHTERPADSHEPSPAISHRSASMD